MAKLLVVDDEEFIQESICDFFNSRGYETYGVSNGEDALALIQSERPHLVLLDVQLAPTGLNGFQVLKKIKTMDKTVKVIIITGKAKDSESINMAEGLGANDYLIKPLNYETLEKEALPKIGAQLFDDFRKEADENRRLYEELQQGMLHTITALANALDARDPYTFGHSERVAEYAEGISAILGYSENERELIRIAGLLHDVGKIGISDEVLRKPDCLTEYEFNEIRSHPEKGASILKPISQLREISDIILHHHERYDGRGYPHGLMPKKASEDPNVSFSELAPWILAVSDAYDAMTSPRPYRDARGHNAAEEELMRCSGSQFHPSVVEAFQIYCREHADKFHDPKPCINYEDYPILFVGENKALLDETRRKLGKPFSVQVVGSLQEARSILDKNHKIYLVIVFEQVSSILNQEVIDIIGADFPHTKIALSIAQGIRSYDQVMNKCQIMKYVMDPSNPLVLKAEIMKGIEEVMTTVTEH